MRLLVANPKLDVGRVRSRTAMFAEVLEAPEVLEHLDRLLAARLPAAAPRRKRPPGRSAR